jgi:hypothetical protein
VLNEFEISIKNFFFTQSKSLEQKLTCVILLNRFPGAVLLRFDPFVDELLVLRVFCRRCRRVDVVDNQ